ncbi:tail fiber protein [Pseudomonas phage EPa61]|uniref:Tail fiber protein n=8 Tax=root TaxID=1 RepID=A0A6M4ETL7_9CAUD|nr:tail fiber protein [Pseudomonas phage F8]YP_009829563.1 tail fiber protein [Pseudomonas phage PA01]YP_009842869.1 tail fiber protein [Pseudomonas phage EPa61]YP_009914422.1 tail fiber protein [Pseudomonas phage crassa]AHH02869.1 tail fiber protein [Pseudomonas phage SPM-1]ELK4888632.1 hypothetical protein [Pseudomonas aeruginosa]QIQ65946.1 hypothetical protein 39_00006 [Pseudomonas phage Epa39]QIQ67382.1 putative structural protein [Pseudomonas phage cory]QIQ67596.1 putative structural p
MNSFLKAILNTPTLTIRDDVTKLPVWKSLQVKKVEIYSPASVVSKPLATKDQTEAQVYTEALDIDVKNGKIIQPVRLRINAICPDLSTVESIMNAFNDNTSTFAITSKSILADKMAIMTLDVDQSPDMLNAAEINMEFEQVEPPVLNEFDPAFSQDRPTYGVQIQSLSDANLLDLGATGDSISSAAKSLYNRVTSYF